MGNKRVSAFTNAGSKANRATKKPKESGRANLHSSEKNQGGNIGAVKYVAGRAGLDFLRVGEGVFDAAAAPFDLVRGDVDMAKSRFMDSPVDEWREKLEQDYNPGKVAGFVGEVAGGLGQSLGYGLISAIPYAGAPMMYSSIVEQGISSAAAQTGEVGLKEIGYGATVGAIEGTLESKLGAGVNAVKGIGSAILKKTGKNVVQTAAKAGGKSMLKTVLTETAKGAAGEFAEEAISEAVDPALLRLYNIDENAQFSLKDVAYAGIVGGISGGIMSAGPSAINYRSAVSAGRSIQEKQLTGDLLKRAKTTLATLDASMAQTEGKIKSKPTGDQTETREERRERKAENRRVRQLSKETRAVADKLRKNIAAYEKMVADPKTAGSDGAAAILGELRGNLFLVGYAYEADVIEEVLMSATPEEKQDFVDEINALFKEQGAKHDYTVADFDANTDDIRRGLAGRLMMDELQGITTEDAAEAPQKPAEAAQKPAEAAQEAEGTKTEEVAAVEQNEATEEAEGEQEDPWESVEGVEGYETQNANEEALLRAASSQGVPKKTVPAMLNSFREGTDLTPAEFADAWADGVMFFGRLGLNEKTVSEGSNLARMTEKARKAAINEGRVIADEEVKRAQEKAEKKKMPARNEADAKRLQEGRGSVIKGRGLIVNDLAPEQYEAYKAAELLAPVLGTDIVIETGIVDKNGKTVNGYYSKTTNRIHVNINARRNGKSIAVYTLGHEVTHYIKAWSPAKFKGLSDFVMEKLGVDAETAIAEKMASLKRLGIIKDTMTVAEANDIATEEVVADGMELILTDGKVLDELAHTDKSLWQKVKAWFADIVKRIRKHYESLNQASKTAQVLKGTVESLEEIERLFTEGAKEAGERARTAEIGEVVQGEDRTMFSYIGETKDGRPCYVSGFDDSVDMDERIKVFKERIATIFNLGAVELKTDVKKIRILGDRFTAQKNIYGDKRIEGEEYKAKISSLYDLADILATSTYDPTATNTEDSYANPAIKPKNKAHDNVKYWYKFRNEIVFDGVPYTVTFNIRDKGKTQYQYLIEFKENKTPGLSNTAVKGLLRTDRMSYDDSITQPDGSVNRKFSISENIPSTLSAEDQNLLFDADFYERYENESREPITETVEELETIKASEAFASMTDDEVFDLNAKLKAKRAGYDTVYDYYVETEKERMAEEYRRYVQTGRSNRTSRALEEKRKKAQKERALRSDEASATPLQNAQYKIIQETNPMWDEYHTGIRSPKEIKTFAEVSEDPESFAWGDFTKEDAQKALRDGSVRVYSSYAIKNGVFVSTSYKQALGYAGNDPARVHSRVVALDSVAWINGDEGQYAKVYKEDNDILYSIDDATERGENADVSGNPFEEAVRRANLSHLLEGNEESATAEAERSHAKAILFNGSDEMRRQLIQDHKALANAMMSEARNQNEYEIAKNYRAKAEELSDLEVNLVNLRKMTYALNIDIDALREKAKTYDDETRPEWLKKELERNRAQKTVWLAEMDALKEKIRTEKHRLLSITAAHPFGNLIAEYVKTADAMARSAERAKEREAERIKAVREKSRKEVYKAKRDATEYKNAVYKKAYEKANAKVAKARDDYKQREQYKDDRREMSVRERVARRVVGRMNTMFYNPTKTKHVPADLQALVEQVLKSEKLDTFKNTRKNLRAMAEMEREIEKLEQNPARTAKEQEKLDKLHYKYAMYEDEGLDAKSQATALYAAFKVWMERRPTELQDKALLEQMSAYIDDMQDMPLSVMSRKSLEAVEQFYKEIYHQVNTANQAFATEKAVAIDAEAAKANTQVKNAKELRFLSPKAREWAALASIRSFLWKNMKPLTVFEAIGSDKLTEIFRRVLDAEDVWITDILEAKEALDAAKKEYGYNKWDLKQRREITTADGSKVSLTLGEMMSLYAYMFREQAEEHLSAGGFVFAPNAEAIESFKGDKGKYTSHLNDQTPHRMRKEDIAKMSDMLTEEQKAYAKTVQEYLTSLGAKGNEVSRKLYGIDLFKETAYFPIKSSHDYIETSTGKSGDPNIKNRGTFKETVPKAGNPIVLEDFMQVVGNHVNTMATYHAFVLPVEDLTRVWNYTPVNIKRDENGKAILDENGMPVADKDGAAGYNSLKAEITKKYGSEANDYILQLLRDLNGGARRESAASILDKGLTAFKRSATMLSLSTIVQQPTSIFRAMAYIKPEYFTGVEKASWETVKKYAPVAAIKEMGGFDTGTGARTSEFLNAKEYDNWKDAAKAAVTPEIYGGDPNVRAQAFGYLTEKADEITWRYMFGACVNEQAAKLGQAKDSEAVLKAAGKRFAEVVRHTQVYDSTLTRSEFMRSKDGLMKMATAFGAEPTTVFSMAAEAIIKLERGDKSFFKSTAAAIAASIIVNAVISSIIYAMRDDDEEKNILEKYTESVTSEIIEGFNPLEYLPIARDVMSVFKGYDIERTDMSLISNLYQQIELLTSSKRSLPDKIAGVSGAVGAFFGLPITNVYRDAKGAALTTVGFFDSEPVTGKGLGNAVGQGIKGQAGLLIKLFGKERGTSYELYRAYVKGDTAHYNRVAARYETDADLEYALRRELRENDKRIVEAAEAKYSGELDVYESLVQQIEAEGIFDRNIVIRAVNNEYNALKNADEKGQLVPKDESDESDEETPESLYTSADLNAAMERGDTADYAEIYDTLVSDRVAAGKTEAQAKASVKSAVTAYWKKQWLAGYQDKETRVRIIKLLTDTGLYGSRNDVATMCEGWVKAAAKNQ